MNNNEKIIVPIDETICEYAQYLFYMSGSYKSVLNDILSNKRDTNANKELLDYYNKEYLKYNVELEILKNELIHSVYDVPEDNSIDYYIDFINSSIVITNIKNKGCTSCNSN